MKKTFSDPGNLFICITVFFACFFISVVVSPYLHYHLQQIAFLKGAEFFRNHTNYPGGLADYVALFISQFFILNTLGSILIVLVISVQGFILLRITKKLIGESQVKYLTFTLFLIFSMVSFMNYYYPFYITIRLLFSLMFTWLFLLILMKYPKQSLFSFITLSIVLYYIASGPALIAFSFSSSLIILITNNKKRTIIHVLLFLLIGIVLPFIGYKYIFPLSFWDVYKISVTRTPLYLTYFAEIPSYFVYLYLPLVLLIVLLFKLKNKKLVTKTTKAPKKVDIKNQNAVFFRKPLVIISLQAIACLIIGLFLFNKYYDPFQKKIRLTEYYADNQEWNKVLETAGNPDKVEASNEEYFRISYQAAHALAHLGQLGERIFEYPQPLGIYGLLVDANHEQSAAITTSDLYFDLGFMGESQRWAFEAQTLLPNSPRVLKRLVVINLVNKKYALANEYLSVLEKNMMYTQWTKKYRKYLSDPDLINNDKEIIEKRTFSPSGTFAFINVEEGLKTLMETNHNNFMAYQYLMSYLLLDMNLDEFIRYLKYYEAFKKEKLPRSWAEALCSYSLNKKQFPRNLSYSLETDAMSYMDSYVSFSKMYSEYKNAKTLEEAAFDRYGKTFWFYSEFANPAVSYNKDEDIEIK